MRATFLAGIASAAMSVGSDGWAPFRAVATHGFGVFDSDLGAIFVDARIGDRAGSFQLDTGANTSVLNDDFALPQGGPIAVEIAGARLSGYGTPSGEHDADAGGTLGLDLFVGHLLSLDLARMRIALDLPSAHLRDAQWIPAEVRDGKFFVAAALGAQAVTNLFVDTGSASTAVTFTRALFPGIMKRRLADLPHVVANAWGKPIVLGYAEPSETLRIGTIDLGRVTALVILDAPERSDIDRYPFPVNGVVGMRAFRGRTIHFDLVRNRFGIEPAAR